MERMTASTRPQRLAVEIEGQATQDVAIISASTRPQRLAVEIGEDRQSPERHGPASTRPQRLAVEIPRDLRGCGTHDARFNEATAISCGDRLRSAPAFRPS